MNAVCTVEYRKSWKNVGSLDVFPAAISIPCTPSSVLTLAKSHKEYAIFNSHMLPPHMRKYVSQYHKSLNSCIINSDFALI